MTVTSPASTGPLSAIAYVTGTSWFSASVRGAETVTPICGACHVTFVSPLETTVKLPGLSGFGLMTSMAMRLVPMAGAGCEIATRAEPSVPMLEIASVTDSTGAARGIQCRGRTVDNSIANAIALAPPFATFVPRLASPPARTVMFGGILEAGARPRDTGIGAILVPVGDGGDICSDDGFAFDGRRNDAPGLARPNREFAAAAFDAMFEIVGLAVGEPVVDLHAAAGQEAALVDFDNAPRPFDNPFDAAISARQSVAVVNRGDQDLRAANGHGAAVGPQLDPAGIWIEVGEIPRSRGLWMYGHGRAGRQQVREIARVTGAAVRERADAHGDDGDREASGGRPDHVQPPRHTGFRADGGL